MNPDNQGSLAGLGGAIQIEESRLAGNVAEVPLRLAIDKGPNEYRRRIAALVAGNGQASAQ